MGALAQLLTGDLDNGIASSRLALISLIEWAYETGMQMGRMEMRVQELEVQVARAEIDDDRDERQPTHANGN